MSLGVESLVGSLPSQKGEKKQKKLYFIGSLCRENFHELWILLGLLWICVVLDIVGWEHK